MILTYQSFVLVKKLIYKLLEFFQIFPLKTYISL